MTNTTTQGFGWPVSFSVNPEKTGIVIYDEDLNPIKLMDMSPEDFGCISDEEILMLRKENLPESISSGYYVRYKLMQLKKRFLEIPKKLRCFFLTEDRTALYEDIELIDQRYGISVKIRLTAETTNSDVMKDITSVLKDRLLLKTQF